MHATNRLQDRSRRRLNPIRIRQSQYLDNRIEPDHRRIKHRIPPMLAFKSSFTAGIIRSDIDIIRKECAQRICRD
ncbi:MAG: DDE domain-containing protein [Mesorhizobium sp.]|nr:DDE domain-containing protein [Mesorhizobium sp. M4B.F.Ca.ET.058.02.1.1]RWD32128.1 MAG: DDE domain-containing protein [Mesorhizobium sp.]TIW11050.1 MAG: DDE domain-containing protein [Mesorhizobium sp.]TIW36690.1 MAG: DDE domain-containing protein [Mesorhizobium sp.]